jgi:ribose 5-phosphate isomerase B
MIYIGADHRGFELKQKLLAHLAAEGIAVRDLGNIHHDPEDDYVDYALKVAEQVKKDEGSKGTLMRLEGVRSVSGKK